MVRFFCSGLHAESDVVEGWTDGRTDDPMTDVRLLTDGVDAECVVLGSDVAAAAAAGLSQSQL